MPVHIAVMYFLLLLTVPARNRCLTVTAEYCLLYLSFLFQTYFEVKTVICYFGHTIFLPG